MFTDHEVSSFKTGRIQYRANTQKGERGVISDDWKGPDKAALDIHRKDDIMYLFDDHTTWRQRERTY